MIARLARLERAGLFFELGTKDRIDYRLGNAKFIQAGMLRGRGFRWNRAFQLVEAGIYSLKSGVNSVKTGARRSAAQNRHYLLSQISGSLLIHSSSSTSSIWKKKLLFS